MQSFIIPLLVEEVDCHEREKKVVFITLAPLGNQIDL